MPSRHLVVELSHGTTQSSIPELAVHIMGTGATVITKPDTVCLNSTVLGLHELDAIKDLTGGLLHLTELVKVVPELALSDNSVGGEDDHTVGLRIRVLVSGSLAANHLEAAHNSTDSHGSVMRRNDNGKINLVSVGTDAISLCLFTTSNMLDQLQFSSVASTIFILFAPRLGALCISVLVDRISPSSACLKRTSYS